MPTKIISIGSGFNQRMGSFQQLLDGKDQYCQDILFSRMIDEANKTQAVYADKRPGFQPLRTVSSGAGGGTALFSGSDFSILLGFGTSTYFGGTSVSGNANMGGVIPSFISEGTFNDKLTFLITDVNKDGWYLPNDAAGVGPVTFFGNTNTNTLRCKHSNR